MADPVACHSGSQYAEYPLGFQFLEQSFIVDEILASWRTPAGKCFRVRVADENFTLTYDEAQDQWRVEQLAADVHVSGHPKEAA